jgi:hypothetical protein
MKMIRFEEYILNENITEFVKEKIIHTEKKISFANIDSIKKELAFFSKNKKQTDIQDSGIFNVIITLDKTVKSKNPGQLKKTTELRGLIKIDIYKQTEHKFTMTLEYIRNPMSGYFKLEIPKTSPGWPDKDQFKKIFYYSQIIKEINNSEWLKSILDETQKYIEQMKSHPDIQKLTQMKQNSSTRRQIEYLLQYSYGEEFNSLEGKEKLKFILDKHPRYIKFIKEPSVELKKSVIKKTFNAIKNKWFPLTDEILKYAYKIHKEKFKNSDDPDLIRISNEMNQ